MMDENGNSSVCDNYPSCIARCRSYFAPREKPTPGSVGEDEIMYIEELLASTTNVLIDNQGDFVDPGSGTPTKGIYSFALSLIHI